MSADALQLNEIERERQHILTEAAEDHGTNWIDQYKPGSFGCHELLDRTAMVSDLLQRFILTHPACALSPEWYALADQASAALCELYQRIGAEHMSEKHTTNSTS